MRHFALSAIGRDRPGIVAAVSEPLLGSGLNVEDSQMAILRGHFAMTLIVAAPDEADPDRVRAELERVRDRLGLEAISLSEVDELDARDAARPSHLVSVYGADHPGILHAVSSRLAERGIDITDLSTRLVGEDEGAPLYVMLLEVAPPGDVGTDELERLLDAPARAQGVEVTVRPLDQDPL